MAVREDRVSRVLVRGAKFSLRNGRLVVLCVALVTALAGFLAVERLGFNLDPNDLFSKELRFQRMIAEFSEHFPVLTNALLVVVDGQTPEATRQAADALLTRLQARTDRFRDAYYPGEESFFERHGLLYNDIDDLDTFADSMARMQPVIGALSQDASLASLSRVIEQGLEHWDPDASDVDASRWRSVLEHFRTAMVSVYAEVPVSVSWESILLEGSPLDPTLRRVIVVDPILDFDRVLAAARPIDAIREEARGLPVELEEQVAIRVTGYPALNHEEFLGLARDTALAGTLSFLFVLLVLFLAFRSMSIVAASALTLLVGFIWTAGYAAIAVERLNVVSIAVAVLYIGLGVDFIIHLGMMIVEALRRGESVEEAVVYGVRETGSALLLCAVTTAVGFLSFLPTAFRGVSELGLITAGGMVAIVILTLTLFPLTLCSVLKGARLEAVRSRSVYAVRFPPPVMPRVIVLAALGLGVVSLLLLPRLELEANVVKIRNPDTESVQTFEDLLEDASTTPWYLDMLAPDLATAQRLAEQVRELPTVDFAVTLADYVPDDQEDKLDLLDDVAFMLDLPGGGERPEVGIPDQLAAMRRLVEVLAPEFLDDVPGGLAASARQLRAEVVAFLARVDGETDPGVAIRDLDARLIAPLPLQFDRLRENLETPGIELASLPQGLVDRMLAADGTARVQVFAREDLADRDAMVEFVESVRPLWAGITGLPVNLVESSYATWDSLKEALAWALGLVSLLLLVLWRRPRDAGLALIPLVLSVLLTAAASALLGWPLNFVNICVLPLLLGIGVDSGVHMVHRAHLIASEGKGELLESTTAQAVFFSAFTTLLTFGTLALSAHQGIASLGSLLLVGMVFSLLGNLVVLPALLALGKPRPGHEAAPH